jgi:hypothetical protein
MFEVLHLGQEKQAENPNVPVQPQPQPQPQQPTPIQVNHILHQSFKTLEKETALPQKETVNPLQSLKTEAEVQSLQSRYLFCHARNCMNQETSEKKFNVCGKKIGRTTPYCCRSCQERDWKDGHQNNCGKLQYNQ